MKNKITIDTRVRYINATADHGYFYPPVGTLGTVVNYDEDGLKVRWDSGTEGDGIWWCDFNDVEVVTETTNKTCWLCDDLDTTINVVCYLPKDNGDATSIELNYCPVCGRLLNDQMVR